MNFLNKALNLIDAVSEWTGKVVSFLIMALAFLVGFEVVMRYVFQSPTVWAGEVSIMMFGTFVIIGGAYTLRYNGHVNMDILHGKFPPRIRALVDIITSFLAFAFVIAILWKGGHSAWKSIKALEHASTLWAPPLYPIRTMVPIGAFLLLLQLLARLIRDIMTLFKKPQRS